MKTRLLSIYDRMFSALGPQHWWPGRTRFEIAVGAILTQNTAWINVEKAIANLRKADLLTAAAMSASSLAGLAEAIRPSGYYNQKAKKLRCFLRYFMDRHSGDFRKLQRQDPRRLREELLQVHGIGPETADSIILYALAKPVFVIDAYTRRIFSRHRLCPEKASYDELQQLFHRHLPHDTRLFNEYHALIVNIGKDYCRKSKPRCAQCPLAKDL